MVLDILKIAAVIVVVVLSIDIFRLIGKKVINNLSTGKLKFLFALIIVIFILALSASLYSLIQYNILEWKSFLLLLVSYTSLRSLRKGKKGNY